MKWGFGDMGIRGFFKEVSEFLCFRRVDSIWGFEVVRRDRRNFGRGGGVRAGVRLDRRMVVNGEWLFCVRSSVSCVRYLLRRDRAGRFVAFVLSGRFRRVVRVVDYSRLCIFFFVGVFLRFRGCCFL